jgi:IS30 family transposase
MEQLKNNTKRKTWQQLNYRKRLKIEILHKEGRKASEIALAVGYSKRTVERELKRGTVTVRHLIYDPIAVIANVPQHKRQYKQTQVYSADAAQAVADEANSLKGRQLKIGNNYEFADYIEEKIVKQGYSPYAALAQAKLDNKLFANLVCVKTIYNYIDNDVFLNLSNKQLWVKKNKKRRKYKKVRVAHNNVKGRSIEERPKEILKRLKQGHWEGDTLYGKGRECLLVLTERKSRKELIFKLKSRTQAEVKKALDKLEKRIGAKAFRKTFKSITFDNGSEFLNQSEIEKSAINKKLNRTTVYYCHSFASWERGSNENANKLIRRFIPKSSSIANYSNKEIKAIENYINNYPRKLLGGYPPNSLYTTPN